MAGIVGWINSITQRALDKKSQSIRDINPQHYANKRGTEVVAAGQLPPADVIKQPKSGWRALPSYLTTANSSEAPLPTTNKRIINTDFNTYRNATDMATLVRNFVSASPDLSAAIYAYVRLAINDKWSAIATNLDGTYNVEATQLLTQIVTRMNVVPSYTDGYGGSYSLISVAESLAREVIMYGAMSSELVLNKALMPWRIQPLHVGHILFIPDNMGDLRPIQRLGGVDTDLDIPTFFYTSLDQDLLTAYSTSPIESALKPTMFAEDFAQDLWRVVKRAVHPRQTVYINWEKLESQIPLDIQDDPVQVTAWTNQFLQGVENVINTLGVDDALVMFDFIKVERDTSGNISLSSEWEVLSGIANAKLATGAKTLPAILGHGVGSSNIASTESLLFVKAVSGAVQLKLNEHLSRIFTLAVRLYGHDAAVEFKFGEINLRPELELESFKSQQQSRILEQLSLGIITDEEAHIKLTGRLPPPGYKPLSGTMFTVNKVAAENPYNGETNDGSTLNQNLKSDAPKGGARGSNKKQAA
jgi:hypothetical protein